MASHVFVTKGDLSKLRCNAWLLPTDAKLAVASAFTDGAPKEHAYFERRLTKPAGWDDHGLRTLRIAPWYAALDTAPAPVPILTNVAGDEPMPIEWYLEGYRQFAVAARDTRSNSSAWRERPLLAVPFAGIAGAREPGEKRELAVRIASALQEIADTHDVDIALVASDDTAYSAMQGARPQRSWVDISEPMRAVAGDLAKRALGGELVVVFGSGISRATGLPTWRRLVDDLARDIGSSDTERRALGELSALDGAALLESRIVARGGNLKASIAERCTIVSYALPHALLATTGVREAVTTNFDRLYEAACADAGRELSVLPHAPLPGAEAWILKLLGSAELPQDLVVTRHDYARYENTRSALKGIVQASLLSRHFFFVGLSLADDNFHTLLDVLRRARNGHASANERFGTALVTNTVGVSEELWSGEISVVSTLVAGDAPAKAPLHAARRTELFLDYLAYRSATPISHLLDDRYAEFLEEQDDLVKGLLLTLDRAIAHAGSGSAAYDPIVRLLKRYGGA